MVVVSSIATTLFLGGWFAPFAGTPFFTFSISFSADDVGNCRNCFYRAPKQPSGRAEMFMVCRRAAVRVVALIVGCCRW